MTRDIEVPELGFIALLRYAWRQLTSMRTALILLMLLGVAAIPGSLIPQRITNTIAVRDLYQTNPELAKWYDRFSLFDVYGSPWFSAIYILLFISLIGCVLPRSFEHYRAMRAQPPATPKNLSRLEHYQEITSDGETLEAAEKWFKKNRFRIRIEENSISAEKGFLRETGNLLFHLSLILILVGVSFGSLFGMRGEAIVNVGERFISVPTSYDTLAFGKLAGDTSLEPFEIKVDKFVAQYNPKTNAPEDYTAWLTVTYQGKTEKKTIKVNKPLTFANTRVYLQANGYSPVVTVRDSLGFVAFQGPVPFLPQDGNLRSIGAIKVPDADPQIGFVGSFVPTNARTTDQGAVSIFPELLDPKLLFSIWKGDLGLDTGIPQSVYKIDTTDLQQIGLGSVKPGETFNYAEGSITLETVVPWINLQVVKDPGKSYALIGGIVAVLGLLSSLYGRRRRIWIRITSQGAEVAGLAKNSAPGLEDEIEKFVNALRRD
ncbi:cytochrome c biogenesis protein [Candidatus Planktophila sulfonica]|uniref:Cytochrome c biogenesis protein n=1 Tax=Candidatus Planktophila sulfonica TaxID=1884904 RepID=A0A249KHY3_9ACTN|nr:cytochrome c biogenesis protein ResB [Candidatus Planktophila sulfonica]ASY16428.1 cytochrome c biogenesis protein [Candidatus Planktophila sulfonica]